VKLCSLFPPILEIASDGPAPAREVTALHSGNLGDVIYSLPTATALGVTHYVLNVCVDPAFGNRALSSEGATKLAPLLLGQGAIRRVTVIASHVPWEYAEPARIGVDYVLDAFRSHGADPSLHLLHRHAHAFGVQVRGETAWLTAEPLREGDLPPGIDPQYVVVSLTNRYRRVGDDYYETLLRDVPPERLIFLGVETDLMHKVSIAGAHLRVEDFPHLARVIQGAALMIGNPSFPYAIAEALKVPRLVELPDGINVAPLDSTGLALHLHSVDSLRTRIFQALGCDPPELSTLREALRERVATLTSQVAEGLDVRQAIETRLYNAECDNLRLNGTVQQLQSTVERLQADDEQLRSAISQLTTGKETLQSALDWSTEDRARLREELDRIREALDRANRLFGRPGFHFKGLVRGVMRMRPLRGVWPGSKQAS